MAVAINKVILIGNVGRDPEIRMTQEGRKFASFSLATSEARRDKSTGEKVERTEWHRIVIFNEHLAEVVEKYVRKGAKLYIEGQIQARKWTDQHGVERYVTEIVLGRYRGELSMLDGKNNAVAVAEETNEVIEDDIPF
jgi:single-strand DNA-binding protein